MALALGLGGPGLLPIPSSAIATAREASHTGDIASDAFHSGLRFFSIAAVVSRSVSDRSLIHIKYIEGEMLNKPSHLEASFSLHSHVCLDLFLLYRGSGRI